jgi:hypothetical protein
MIAIVNFEEARFGILSKRKKLDLFCQIINCNVSLSIHLQVSLYHCSVTAILVATDNQYLLGYFFSARFEILNQQWRGR